MFHDNSRECSVGFPYHEIDAKESPPAPAADSAAEVLEFARRLVSYIRSKDRCRLTVDCLYLALGDADLESVTMTDVAKAHGVTKAWVSKRAKAIRQELHLPVNANNKSADATQRYRKTNCSPLRLDRHPVRVPGVPTGAGPRV
jgi:hypothetical protein